MKNNPNQEIHTDYRANDIFKPINANRLAESIHYDFVITQEMLDKYMEQNPGDTTIGIGVLLNSNSDGTKNDTYAILAKAPVSVFIAAKTPDNVVYDFTYAFVTTSNGILDISDFLDNGQYSVLKTDGAVNVYSEYPYKANITGGVNFHSTPKAPLTVGIVQNNGVIRIGAYRTTDSSPINVFRNGDIKIITQEQLSGYGFADVLSSDSQNPDVFVADWMGGGCSGDLGYSISETDTLQYGLFDRFAESYRLGTRASLFVRHAQSTSVYHRDHGSSYDTTFSNASEGRKITIHKDGTIKKENIGSSGGGSVDKVVLVDFDVSDLPDSSALNSIKTYYKNQRSVYRSNEKQFKAVSEDVADPGYVQWYSTSVGQSNEMNLFKFKGAVTLDWYKWNAISSLNAYGTATDVQWYYNTRDLYIDAESLEVGIVYEVNVHIMLLPAPTYTATFGSTKTCMKQASPCDTPTDPPNFNNNVKPQIQFWDAQAKSSHNNVRYWGGDSMQNTPYCVYPSLSAKVPNTAYPDTQSGTSIYQFKELASGSIQFVKLADGYIYIMKY